MPSRPGKDRYIDAAVAADRLDVCRETIYRYLRDGTLPARRLGGRGRYRILAQDFERFAGVQLERTETQKAVS
jgi:excisionase family DNA binding protein